MIIMTIGIRTNSSTKIDKRDVIETGVVLKAEGCIIPLYNLGTNT
jgi:hypothetical protein